ncbi:Uncharacterized isomerase yddE [Sebaldella termitidis]|uniref:Phenazine biosynthesis protein PhzF family n=1 Tax=Sebaldella termitidis (strain ATCC 33386 / NCTC 11300) TaxID=526218 RepID=D1AHI0_SEBTE|nr:PhzF family phenazine biosynthesis protein [Sebaldella termitidis]ACZ08214.1 phenazine biosynthesis protein PhzF family [Sebaldella termitidis ATCC 33386]SUI23517.1 Uncharacterized isomerase yddE [Sebaldella termitidis]
MKYFIVDAFTDHHFSGNPAGVCLLEEPIADEIMQNIAAENNLAETAFILKQGNEYNLRWFTPEQEFDLCGHATLASAYVLFQFVDKKAEHLVFSTQSGILEVTRNDGLLEMDFPSRPPEQIEVTELMENALGVPIMEAHLSRDMILVLQTEKDVYEAVPDLDIVSKIPGCVNLIITAQGREADFVSRYFTPGISIPEDPVTGSAHSSLIPFWAKRLGKEKLTAHQLSKRGGILYCQDKGDRVKISGNAILYLAGEIYL